jgi:hypothetical protein
MLIFLRHDQTEVVAAALVRARKLGAWCQSRSGDMESTGCGGLHPATARLRPWRGRLMASPSTLVIADDQTGYLAVDTASINFG